MGLLNSVGKAVAAAFAAVGDLAWSGQVKRRIVGAFDPVRGSETYIVDVADCRVILEDFNLYERPEGFVLGDRRAIVRPPDGIESIAIVPGDVLTVAGVDYQAVTVQTDIFGTATVQVRRK